jgi:hypothetical protein
MVGGWHPGAELCALTRPQPLPRTDRTPVLLALPTKFSAKQVYLPSSERLIFLIIKVPSGVTVTLQQGQGRCANLGTCHSHGEGTSLQGGHAGAGVAWVGPAWYLLLLTKISVPLLQSTVALGAARGWQGIVTSPPRAAGIRRLTGFCLKSGASAARKGEGPMVTHRITAVPITLD